MSKHLSRSQRTGRRAKGKEVGGERKCDQRIYNNQQYNQYPKSVQQIQHLKIGLCLSNPQAIVWFLFTSGDNRQYQDVYVENRKK